MGQKKNAQLLTTNIKYDPNPNFLSFPLSANFQDIFLYSHS